MKKWIIALCWLILLTGHAHGEEPAAIMKTVVSVVGPRNLTYLPIDLIPAIGLDREEGLAVQLLHVGGGGLAIKEMANRNSEFTVVGFPALMSLKASGGELVGLASVSDASQFVLMVRAGLKDQVKRIADLKGRIIGVHTSSVNAKTAAQQLLELLLQSDGLSPFDARVVSSGQDWKEREEMLEQGKVDAIVSEEPFATSMLAGGKVFFLANLAEPETTSAIPGANFLHATLATRPDLLKENPEKARRMVNATLRSLKWISSHTPEELVEKLAISDPKEKEHLLVCLKKYAHLFSKDGKFSRRQIRETNHFFHAVNPESLSVNMENLIDARFVGQKE